MLFRKIFVACAFALVGRGVGAQSWQAKGTWYAPATWDICAITLSLLPDGRLLAWNWSHDDTFGPLFHVRVTPPPMPGNPPDYTQMVRTPFPFQPLHQHELFCAGTAYLPDGRLLAVGGHRLNNIGLDKVKIFDYRDNSWLQMSSMTPYPPGSGDSANGRWYPTVMGLPNGDYIFLSGTRDQLTDGYLINDYPEIWTPPVATAGDQISRLLNPDTGDPVLMRLKEYYPLAFIHPTSGNLLVLASNSDANLASVTGNDRSLNLASLTLDPINTCLVPNIKNDYPSAVMIDGIIVKSGGSAHGADGKDDDPNPGNRAVPAVANSAFMKVADNHLPGTQMDVWKSAPLSGRVGQMNYARKNHTLVALPDGKVLAMGGCYKRNVPGASGGPIEGAEERTTPEMYDPLNPNQDWQLLAGPPEGERIPRPYHSTALLLPDARIVVAGGEREFDRFEGKLIDTQRAMQLFAPPYGGKEETEWRQEQPIVTASSGLEAPVMRYGEPFSVRVTTYQGRPIKSISLISIGTMTHAFNSNQQFVFLHKPESTPLNPGSIDLTAPASTTIARPGYYMLFAIDSQGVPSNALMVRLADFEPFAVSNVSVTYGKVVGNLNPSQLRMSENAYLGDGISASASAQCEFVADVMGTSRPMSRMRVRVEAKTSTPTTLLVSVYNFAHQSYETVGTSTLSTVEQVRTLELAGARVLAGDYLKPNESTPTMRIRIRSIGAGHMLKVDALRVSVRPPGK